MRKRARLILNSKDHHELDVDEIKVSKTWLLLLRKLSQSCWDEVILCHLRLCAFLCWLKLCLSYKQYNMLYWRRRNCYIRSSTEIPNDSGENQKNLDSTVGEDLHAHHQDSKTPTLNTSIDSLFSGGHTSTNLPDLDKEDASHEKKRKKKKKEKEG